jgi:hypothetical protein
MPVNLHITECPDSTNLKHRPQSHAAARPKGTSAPTPGPWSIEHDDIVYRHWRYASYPLFGRITVASLERSWPQGEERRANSELIVTAVNACFTLAPESPMAAARAFPALVNAVEAFLTHGDDPNMPLEELKGRLRSALGAVKGGLP